jgi:nucleoside-diphosphate-sugar epimerase
MVTLEHSPWRGRRALVTGVTGFLGGAVARELLVRGAEVIGLVHHRPDAELLAGLRLVHGRADNVFRLHSAMAVNEVTAVFHLAAHDPFGDDRGTAALLQAVKLYSRRVPVVAARPLPHLALARDEEPSEGRLSVVRFGEVFGPGDRKLFRAVPAAAYEVLRGEPVGPSDRPARDFVFVGDAARACLLAAEAAANSGPGDHAFRSGWLFTERQMADAVRAAAAGRAPEVPDSAPAANPLGWRPAQSLAEALKETLAWYRSHLGAGRAELRAAA